MIWETRGGGWQPASSSGLDSAGREGKNDGLAFGDAAGNWPTALLVSGVLVSAAWFVALSLHLSPEAAAGTAPRLAFEPSLAVDRRASRRRMRLFPDILTSFFLKSVGLSKERPIKLCGYCARNCLRGCLARLQIRQIPILQQPACSARRRPHKNRGIASI